MITASTPWSITWQENISQVITFNGEWTLEPKFYLLLPVKPCWDESKILIDGFQLEKVLAGLKSETTKRGWVIVIEKETGQSSK